MLASVAHILKLKWEKNWGEQVAEGLGWWIGLDHVHEWATCKMMIEC